MDNENNSNLVDITIGEPPADPIAAEVEALRARISEYELREKRAYEEAQLREYFPDVEMDCIPDEVHELSRTAMPLAAAYALYMRATELRRIRAAALSAEAERKSAGRVSGGEAEEFSSEEIARMSRADVRRNYGKVLRSLGR